MGRQHRHARTVTVERAMNLFWRSGFSGTSLRDLEQCLDMRPGSIYARFGNKEHLYAEAMALYAAKTFAIFRSHMDRAETFVAGLRHFMEQLLFTPETPCGCLLVKTLVQTTPDNNELKRKAGQMIMDFEDCLVTELEKAIKSGEINNNCAPQAFARYIQIQIIGIRSYAEIEQRPEVISQLLDNMMTSLAAKITKY